MNIALIGAGNVGWHLGKALHVAGHTIEVVYSRTPASSAALAAELGHTSYTTSLDLTELQLQAVLIAVPDAALREVAQQLKVPAGTMVAHTSGSQPLAALDAVVGARTGVFYPLQTFSKEKDVNLKETPLLVEAQEPESLQQLQQLAESISDKVYTVASPERKKLHLAAVFACNFTNHLLGISRELLQQAHLPVELLQPLIRETIAKASQHHPFSVQTGPAVRNDQNVLQEHQHMLEHNPHYQQLYLALSQSIQEQARYNQ